MIKKSKLYVSFLVVALTLIIGQICYAEEKSGYYIISTEDGDQKVKIQILKAEMELEGGNIALNNTIIYPIENPIYIPYTEKMSDMDTMAEEVKLQLLRNGNAVLADESIALEEERNAQYYAKGKEIGCWKKASWLEVVLGYVKEHYQWIISITVGSGIIISIITYVKRKLVTRKKAIILGGAEASGKTTLKKLLLNSNATRWELIISRPTRKLKINDILWKDENSRYWLDGVLVDCPGGKSYQIAHNLVSYKYRKGYQNVMVIMLAATKSNDKKEDIDQNYIEAQRIAIDEAWCQTLRTTVADFKLSEIILFLNKNDLFSSTDKLNDIFEDHIRLVEKLCLEKGIKFMVINGSALEKAGITDLKDELFS